MLAFMILMGGRQIRLHLLLDDHGLLKTSLWLDEWVLPPEASAAESTKAGKKKLVGKLSINQCSREELCLLPGVGPVMAARIDEVRSRGQFFTCALDLERVKGIGEKLSAKLDTLLLYSLPVPNRTEKPDSLIFSASADSL